MLKLPRAEQVRLVAITALSLLVATTLTACKAQSNYFASTNSSVGAGDGSAVDATAGLQFRIKAKTGVDSFVHKFGDVTEGCEVPLASKDTPTEVRCMLNMMEYDIWFYGFEYEVSVPKDFCTYLRETPYRFYKGEPGAGPSAINITTNNGVITGCTIDGVAGSTVGGVCSNSEASFKPDGSISSCAYDYSRANVGSIGPNCCVGRAQGTLTATVGGVTNATPIDVSFGGSYYACTESPYDFISDWPKTTTSQKAAILISDTAGGSLVKGAKIPGVLPLSTTRPAAHAVFFNAGFHGWDEYATDPTTWDATVQMPRAFAPVADRGGAGTHAGIGATTSGAIGDGSYHFECLGPAGERRHDIKVYANAWNTIEDYQAFKANGDASAVDPNRTGVAGVNCSAVNGGSCNTMWGFDDMIKDTSPVWGGNGSAAAWVFPYEFSYMPDPY